MYELFSDDIKTDPETGVWEDPGDRDRTTQLGTLNTQCPREKDWKKVPGDLQW